MKVYEAIAKACAVETGSPLFALMGDGNMELLAAFHSEDPERVVHARHENAAVAMADGWARAAGDVGLCTVTCGPGLTQVATSAVVASRQGTPVVILAGDTPRTAQHHLQALVQAPFVDAMEAAFVPVASVDTVLEDVRHAFYLARVRSGPVVLSMPMDVQQETHPWGWGDYMPSASLVPRTPPVGPSSDDLAQVVAALASAERIVVLAGRGAVASGARPAIRLLADELGALLATSLRAKGAFDGVAWDAGVAGAFSSSAARELFAEADCVLAFGAGLGYFTTEGGYLFPSATIIQVDVQPRGIHEGQPTASQHIAGDARVVAETLLGLVRGGPDRGAYRTEATRAALDTSGLTTNDPPEGGLSPDVVLATINQHLPPMSLTIGAGHFWNFAIPAFHGRSPGDYLFTYDFGCIGQGLPVAMGAALATGRAAVIEGDGSLLMNLQELETLARHQIPVLCFVMNDGAYGAEVHKLRAKGLSAEQVDFGRTDLAGIAASVGIDAEVLKSVDQVPGVIDRFVAGSSPVVVDVHISPHVIAPTYRRLYYGEIG